MIDTNRLTTTQPKCDPYARANESKSNFNAMFAKPKNDSYVKAKRKRNNRKRNRIARQSRKHNRS